MSLQGLVYGLIYLLGYRLALGLGYLLMDELSQAYAQFYTSGSGGMSGGHSTPPGSFDHPYLIPDDADDQPGGPSEEAKPQRRARRRTVTQFPDYASFQRALNRKEELVALMEQILQEQGIHVEDPHNVERAVDYYLQKSSEPHILEGRLPWLKESLSSEKEKSRFYQRVLGILKKC